MKGNMEVRGRWAPRSRLSLRIPPHIRLDNTPHADFGGTSTPPLVRADRPSPISSAPRTRCAAWPSPRMAVSWPPALPSIPATASISRSRATRRRERCQQYLLERAYGDLEHEARCRSGAGICHGPGDRGALVRRRHHRLCPGATARGPHHYRGRAADRNT